MDKKWKRLREHKKQVRKKKEQFEANKEPYPLPDVKNSRYSTMELSKECPYCGGAVIHTSNVHVYGKVYGNGMIWMCEDCTASVGCHPDGAPLGILANTEMKELKRDCHKLFDPLWKEGKMKRKEAYRRLAKRLDIQENNCHFGFFNEEQLTYVLKILRTEKWYEKES